MKDIKGIEIRDGDVVAAVSYGCMALSALREEPRKGPLA